MSDRVFLDTNVLIYLYDTDASRKQEIARQILAEHGVAGTACISTQVVQEFYVTLTRKFARRLAEEQVLYATHRLRALSMTRVDLALIFAAIDLSRQHKISFWDALIVEAALEAGCTRLLTEDLQHGWRVRNLQVENPFL
jgi:predicted nucleic acid-binding protein